MSLLLLHNRESGLVKSGLEAYYNSQKTNLLQYSEQLDNAVWGPGTVSPDQATSPRGDQTADIITDDSATSASIFLQAVPIESSSATYTLSVFVKKDNDESRFPEFRIKPAGGALQPTTAGHLNTKTGQFQIRTGLGSMSVSDEGDYWRVAVSETDTDSGNAEVRCSILPAFTDVLGAAANSSTTGSVTVWGAQLNQGSTALAYEATTDNQSLLDVSGKGNHGELGSSPAVDGNDPIWGDNHLSFSGLDDYVTVPSSLTANTEALTMQVVFRKVPGSAVASNRTLLGENALGSYARFVSDTAVDFSVTGSVSEKLLQGPGGAIADDGAWKMLTFRWNSGVVQDQILNADNRIAFNETDPASGQHASTFQVVGMFNNAHFFEGDMASVLIYRRFLNDGEVLQNYRALTFILSNLGINLP